MPCDSLIVFGYKGPSQKPSSGSSGGPSSATPNQPNRRHIVVITLGEFIWYGHIHKDKRTCTLNPMFQELIRTLSPHREGAELRNFESAESSNHGQDLVWLITVLGLYMQLLCHSFDSYLRMSIS